MEAKGVKILNELIEGVNRCFTVPTYQRNYVWKKKNVETLLKDLKTIETDGRREYFIGTFITKRRKSKYSNFLDELSIIDGQQRLTTFLLILISIREYVIKLKNRLKKDEDSETHRRLIDRISMVLELNDNKGGKNKLKLNRVYNSEIVDKMIQSEFNQLTDKMKESTYFLNYEIITNWIKNNLKTIDDIWNYYSICLTSAKVAEIRLDDDDDENIIFSKMNSESVQLTFVDLIKSYLVMKIENYENQDDIEKRIDEVFDLIRTQDEMIDFFRQYIGIKIGKLVSKKNNIGYEVFKNNLWSEDILDDIEKNIKYWNKINSMNYKDYGWENFLLFESNLKNYYGIIYNIVKSNSYYTDEKEVVIDNVDKMKEEFKRLTSYIISSRILVNKGRVEGNRSFAKWGYKLETEDIKLNRILLEETLRNSSLSEITLNEIFEKVNDTNIYENHSASIKWLLISIEYSISNKIPINENKISIEHIFPQNSLKIKKLYSDDEYEKTIYLLHSLGNLTITDENSRLSNNDIKSKKDILNRFGYFKINKDLKEKQNNEWNSEAIKNRSKELLDKIHSIWNLNRVNKEEIENMNSYKVSEMENWIKVSSTYKNNLISNEGIYFKTKYKNGNLSGIINVPKNTLIKGDISIGSKDTLIKTLNKLLDDDNMLINVDDINLNYEIKFINESEMSLSKFCLLLFGREANGWISLKDANENLIDKYRR
ncbi:MAG: DUF262 domain-containing HNH endonuclease family protein [Mycoplasma sp.]|nr:DUF262 domain-containing HNH endonuclease family protein [Mycoplasma sp.]